MQSNELPLGYSIEQPTTTTYHCESIDLKSYHEEDAINDDLAGIPFRFGANIDVNIDFMDQALSTTVNNGIIRRLTIVSRDAQAINFQFDRFHLAAGTKLWIYNQDHNDFIGALTSKNNKEHQELGTIPVKGDRITIELFEPTGVTGSTLNIKTVTHGYRAIPTAQLKAAGSCNVNAICEPGDEWAEQKRAVAMIVVNGNGYCSGTLINNTCHDSVPYFLTANHCTGGNVSTWVMRFNYASSDCATDLPPGTNQSISGATLRSSEESSDFALVELSSRPPDSYNVFYAGWNRTKTPSMRQVTFHHPGGALKKVSVDLGAVDSTEYQTKKVWRIFDWEIGTTEGGSSGSGLFNQHGHIVGQLYGGAASCSNNAHDNFGRFDLSWDGTGTNATRLSNWLDGCATNDTIIPGLDLLPNANLWDMGIVEINKPLDSSTTCSDQIIPFIRIKNYGVNAIDSFVIHWELDGAHDSLVLDSTITSLCFADLHLPALTYSVGSHQLVAYSEVLNDADLTTSNDTLSTYFTYEIPTSYPLPISEHFEGTFPAENWTVYNPGQNFTWATTTVGGFGSSNTCVRMNNFAGNNRGHRDDLNLPILDLSSESTVTLDFSVAYAQYDDTFHDSLIVYLSTDCGQHWDHIYAEGSTSLATSGNTSSQFTPSPAQWRRETLDLSSYAGASHVQIKFQSYSGWGNALYVDDINIYSELISDATFTDSTLCYGGTTTVNNLSTAGHLWEWISDSIVFTDSSLFEPGMTADSPGTYTLQLVSSNGIVTDTSDVITLIIADSLSWTTATTNELDTGATNGSVTLNDLAGTSPFTYVWNNGATTNPINNLDSGLYVVTVTDNFGCHSTDTAYVGLTTLSSIVGLSLQNIGFYPNPTSRLIQLEISQPIQSVSVIDAIGRETNIPFTQQTIDLGDLPSGMYSIRLNGVIIKKKVIKQK